MNEWWMYVIQSAGMGAMSCQNNTPKHSYITYRWGSLTSEARCDTCILVKTNSLSFAAAVHFKDKDTCM